MGMTSDWAIEEFNCRYETDEEFRQSYDEQMRIDAALEAEFFEREREMEMLEEHFDDKLLDVRGAAIELPDIDAAQLIDDDLPF